jgi:hypothetical protein
MKSILFVLLSLLAMTSHVVTGFSTSNKMLVASRIQKEQQALYQSSRVLNAEENYETLSETKTVDQQLRSDDNQPVDFVLLGGLASITALATMAWIATDSTLVQTLEEDPSAATLIVDGVFGGVAAVVTFLSRDK